VSATINSLVMGDFHEPKGAFIWLYPKIWWNVVWNRNGEFRGSGH